MEKKLPQNQKSNQKALEVHIPIERSEKNETYEQACGSESSRRIKYSSLQTVNRKDDSDSESEARLLDLVNKTTAMSKESDDREKEMSEAFRSLREKLEINDKFLKNKKEQLQKMIFQFQRDRARLTHADHIGDCLENSTKTTEELESEMQKITERIDQLKVKVQKIKAEQPEKDEGDYKVSLEKAVAELEKISNNNLDESGS